jgi:hypothetical protein
MDFNNLFNNLETVQTNSQAREKNGSSSSVRLLVKAVDEDTMNIMWHLTRDTISTYKIHRTQYFE